MVSKIDPEIKRVGNVMSFLTNFQTKQQRTRTHIHMQQINYRDIYNNNSSMMLSFSESIPTFGSSIGFDANMMDDMPTVHRGMFDELPEDAVSSTTNNYNKHKVVPIKAAAGRPQRRKRIRRPIPEKKEYIPEDEPTDNDVISGRGGRSNVHRGNKMYWIQVLCERPAYLAYHPNDEEKNVIAKKVYKYVTQNQFGRFVQLDTKTNKWFVLPEKVALIKIKQALRDKHVPKWAEGLLTEESRSLLAGPHHHKQVDNQPATVQVDKPHSMMMGSMNNNNNNNQAARCRLPDELFDIQPTPILSSCRVTPDNDLNEDESDDDLDLGEILGFGNTNSSSSWTKSIDMIRDVIGEFVPSDDDVELLKMGQQHKQKLNKDDNDFWDNYFFESLEDMM